MIFWKLLSLLLFTSSLFPNSSRFISSWRDAPLSSLLLLNDISDVNVDAFSRLPLPLRANRYVSFSLVTSLAGHLTPLVITVHLESEVLESFNPSLASLDVRVTSPALTEASHTWPSESRCNVMTSPTWPSASLDAAWTSLFELSVLL